MIHQINYNDTIWLTDDTIRLTKDTIRITIRLTNDTIRLINDTIRFTHDTTRLPNGTIRITNDTIRITNVTIKSTHDTIRLTDVTIRWTNFTVRSTNGRLKYLFKSEVIRDIPTSDSNGQMYIYYSHITLVSSDTMWTKKTVRLRPPVLPSRASHLEWIPSVIPLACTLVWLN